MAARMERFLRNLTAHIMSIQLLLIAPPPMHPGKWVNERRLLAESTRLGLCYRTLTEMLGDWLCRHGHMERGNGAHFSEAGHAAFAKGLLSQLLQQPFRDPFQIIP